MKITFITGGVRSGKSRFAEKLAMESGEEVVYIATAQALDEEMKRRIKLHIQRRPLKWKTVEETLNVSEVLSKINNDIEFNQYGVLLIDCLTLLVSNWLPLENVEDSQSWEDLRNGVLNEINNLVHEAKKSTKHVIIVSNEVGMGLVPEYPLGRLYRDLLGEINAIIAGAADEVYFMISGIPWKIR
jgi:adenosylcobinamide kinase/adenosylcobinamide-phosphate guanylyltransferase